MAVGAEQLSRGRIRRAVQLSIRARNGVMKAKQKAVGAGAGAGDLPSEQCHRRHCCRVELFVGTDCFLFEHAEQKGGR